ncbi:MAG: thioesterase family protein [Pseudomonadota bacterium]
MSDLNTLRTNYRYFSEVTTRWMDNDVYGHVNNVTYYSYFDTVANKYLIEEAGLDIHTADIVGFVVASSCQYLAPIAYPEIIEVGFRANRLGRSSVEYGIGIFRQGGDEAIAHGTFTHVFVNRKSGGSAAIPEPIRAALEAVVLEQ